MCILCDDVASLSHEAFREKRKKPYPMYFSKILAIVKGCDVGASACAFTNQIWIIIIRYFRAKIMKEAEHKKAVPPP